MLKARHIRMEYPSNIICYVANRKIVLRILKNQHLSRTIIQQQIIIKACTLIDATSSLFKSGSILK